VLTLNDVEMAVLDGLRERDDLTRSERLILAKLIDHANPAAYCSRCGCGAGHFRDCPLHNERTS
jgi:hypothetical protein